MKKNIVISAINLRSGGPLTIMNECLQYLDAHLADNYRIIALVHSKELIIKTKNIEIIEFPRSTKSYLHRFRYEYYTFHNLSKEIKPYLWLSLHDITPRVHATIQAVYCHNATPFYNVSIKELFLDSKFVFFTWFYKYIYKINIRRNDFVIVQQEWIRKRFMSFFKIQKCIVAYPENTLNNKIDPIQKTQKEKITFFYPSFPRVFKNFEVACKAFENVRPCIKDKVELIITIDGSENSYSKLILKKYSKSKNIKFIGLQTREEVFNIYSKSDCLIFPSKLETWGLPITEFKLFNKPIFLADMEYARETIGTYNKLKFFKSNDFMKLASLIENFVEGTIKMDSIERKKIEAPFSNSWKQLFQILLSMK